MTDDYVNRIREAVRGDREKKETEEQKRASESARRSDHFGAFKGVLALAIDPAFRKLRSALEAEGYYVRIKDELRLDMEPEINFNKLTFKFADKDDELTMMGASHVEIMRDPKSEKITISKYVNNRYKPAQRSVVSQVELDQITEQYILDIVSAVVSEALAA